MEKIIYSDTLNQTEFLRTLAKRGIKTLGLRVMSSYDLALLILSKLGTRKEGRYINNEEQDFIYYSLLKPNSFSDASNIRSAINSFRDTGNGNSFDELKPFLNRCFKKKYNTLEEAFEAYNAYKQKENLYDLYDILYELKDNKDKISTKVIYFKDMPYSPLAIEVFEKYFDLEEASFSEFIGSKTEPKLEVYKCYGKSNEFASVFNKIAEKCISFDKCLVVLTNPADITGMINRLDKYGIHYSSSIGYPVGQTNVGKLIAKIKMMKAMQYSVDAFKGLFESSFFNKDKYFSSLPDEYTEKQFVKFVGWLKPSFDKDAIQVDASLYRPVIASALQIICKDINNGKDKFYEFIESNVVDDNYKFEALKLLEKYLTHCEQYGVSFDTVVDALLNSTISQHISHSGSIHISSLTQAFSSLREHVFVIGLDSSFPGNPKENYLIYDEEYEKMHANKYISSEIVNANKELMELLIKSANNAYLSYTYYDTIDVKEINPSSVIYQMVDDIDHISEFSYKEDNLSLNKELIDKFNKGFISESVTFPNNYNYDPTELLNREYSASSFGDFFTNKLAFILNVIYQIDVEEPDEPYVIYSVADRGTLFHSIAEGFEKSKISEQDFVNNGLKAFDNFMKRKPAIVNESMVKERGIFKKGLINLYRGDPGNKCVMCEEKMTDCNIHGIRFKGKFDRLEYNETLKKYILVDYKTGSSMHHEAEDPESCLQALIYAAMIKKIYSIDVSYCEFRYPFVNDSVGITINKETDKALKAYIEQFIEAVKNHDFSCFDEDYMFVDKYEHLISLMKELKR